MRIRSGFHVSLLSFGLAAMLFGAVGFAAETEQQLIDGLTNYDFAPQACLSPEDEAAWSRRENSQLSPGSQALESFLAQKVSRLAQKYSGKVSTDIKSDNYPKCGNWCRKYPMRFSGRSPVLDSLDQSCKELLLCYREAKWSCDCFRKFAYDIYAGRDPTQPISDNEEFVFFYFSEFQCDRG